MDHMHWAHPSASYSENLAILCPSEFIDSAWIFRVLVLPWPHLTRQVQTWGVQDGWHRPSRPLLYLDLQRPDLAVQLGVM